MDKGNSGPSDKKETGKKPNQVTIDLSHKQNEAKSSGGLSIIAFLKAYTASSNLS